MGSEMCIRDRCATIGVHFSDENVHLPVAMGHFVNRHHFYSKNNQNDADSSKGLSVRTLEDQCSIVNSICLVSKIASAVNKKVQPYRSITLECTGLILREVPDGRRSRGTYTALTMQHTGILSTCVSRHRAFSSSWCTNEQRDSTAPVVCSAPFTHPSRHSRVTGSPVTLEQMLV